MNSPLTAIIGGRSLSRLEHIQDSHCEVVRTPYGEASSPLTFGRWGDQPIVFLARHGSNHTLLAHKVNYRANIWALKKAGAARVVALVTVGAIHQEMAINSLALPDQIVDYTWGRSSTFHDKEGDVVHVDFTHPYDEKLRRELTNAAQMINLPIATSGVYAVVSGPRLETVAEIRRLAQDGANMVGMTAMPEAALARELDLPYANIAAITNWAAGRGPNSHAVAMDELRDNLASTAKQAMRLLASFFRA